MNYYDYLNKLITTNGTQYYRIDSNSYNQQNQSNPFVDAKITTTVSYNGASIFNSAKKSEIEKLDYQKLSDLLSGTKQDQQLNPLEFVIGKFLSLQSVKEKADTIEKDGKLSIDEIKQFVKSLFAIDGNEDLTSEDFDKYAKDNNIDLDNIYQNEITQGQTQQAGEQTQQAGEQTQQAGEQTQQTGEQTQQETTVQNGNDDSQQTVSDNGQKVDTSTDVSKADNVSTNQSVGASDKTVDSSLESTEVKSLEELEKEKEGIQNTVKEKREAIKDIHSGKNEKIKAANEKVAEARKEYEKALDKDNKAKLFKGEIIANNKAIEKNEKAIEKNAQNILDKEKEIKEIKEQISSSTTLLEGLKTALSGLKEPTEGDKKEYNKEKDKLTKRINEIEQDIISKQKKLKQLEEIDLKNLTDEKTRLDTEKQKLLATKEQLDKKVNQECLQATKDALVKWNKAREELDTLKSGELETAQKELETAEKSLTDINAKIAERKTQEETSKYHDNSIINANGQTKDLNYWISQGYDPEKGKRLAQATVAQTTGFHEDCAGGVRRGINNAGLGDYKRFRYGKVAGDLLAKNPNFREVSPEGIDPEKDLPDGAILIYNPGVAGYHRQYGHMETVFTGKKGDKKAASDGITNNIRKHVSRIFIPV